MDLSIPLVPLVGQFHDNACVFACMEMLSRYYAFHQRSLVPRDWKAPFINQRELACHWLERPYTCRIGMELDGVDPSHSFEILNIKSTSQYKDYHVSGASDIGRLLHVREMIGHRRDPILITLQPGVDAGSNDYSVKAHAIVIGGHMENEEGRVRCMVFDPLPVERGSLYMTDLSNHGLLSGYAGYSAYGFKLALYDSSSLEAQYSKLSYEYAVECLALLGRIVAKNPLLDCNSIFNYNIVNDVACLEIEPSATALHIGQRRILVQVQQVFQSLVTPSKAINLHRVVSTADGVHIGDAVIAIDQSDKPHLVHLGMKNS